MKYMKLGSKLDAFQSDGNNIRFVDSELATDIIVNVRDVKFYLHKFPLLSKSPHIQRLVSPISEEGTDEIDMPDLPGGPAAFEICAKFCYGMIVTLNAYNVVAARCAAEYLEMHENVEKGNLIYKIDVFLSSSVFRSWKDSIIVLETTKFLQPWSEDLKLVSHCIDSIASKASIGPTEVDWSYTYNRKKLPSENGIDTHWNGVRRQQTVPKDWWVEDLCELELDSYKRVIMAIKMKGRVSVEAIGEALKAYAYRRIPLFDKSSNTHEGDLSKFRILLENIVWLLPPRRGSVSCSFLLKLLKAVKFLDGAENCKRELIKRIGQQLEEASVEDLLLPASVGEALYDIDMLINIMKAFLMQEHGAQSSGELQEGKIPASASQSSMIAVSKLIDGFLAEAAKDYNFTLSKFVELAQMISGSLRQVHDGLYHAVDTFLKEHPYLSKTEKKKICSLIDCKKLSPEACLQAVQNDRLPLRVVVQILFFEQMRQSAASEAVRSQSCTRSAATNNANKYCQGVNLVGNERSSGSGETSKNEDGSKGGEKVKGILMPKRLMSKLWSGKVQIGGENSSSETSESPNSIHHEAAKSTPSRNNTGRYSVS